VIDEIHGPVEDGEQRHGSKKNDPNKSHGDEIAAKGDLMTRIITVQLNSFPTEKTIKIY